MKTSTKLKIWMSATALLVATLVSPAAAANNVSVMLSNPTPSATGVTQTWTWSGYQTAASVQCIHIRMSTNADGTGGLPAGMSVATSTLTGTYGGTWTRDATNAASGVVVFNWATGVTPGGGPTTLVLGNVTNPSSAATSYQTVTTYATAGSGSSGACAGGVRDSATVVPFETEAAQSASVTVDPSLSLVINTVAAATACGNATTTVASTAGNIPLGRVSAVTAHPIAGQNLTVTTNAAGGYTTYISYSGAMTGGVSGATISDIGAPNSAPIVWPANGTEAFGYHTSSTSLSGTAARFATNKYAALTTTGTEVMRNTATPGPSGDTNCVAFQASIAGNTEADTYTTAVRYNVAGTF